MSPWRSKMPPMAHSRVRLNPQAALQALQTQLQTLIK